MCGGDLDALDGITVAECEYCGTRQTLPKVSDENLQNLYNRANILRIKSEFDKAEKLYEKIIQTDSTESEAYWGLILCRYGIEYVDDPATNKKVPTCHRASYSSIVADDDYKSAIANADAEQRAIYEAQAREIDGIQKEILALAQKEENYDVFICYKETDKDGNRTQDSVIANDIYHQLKNEGFKVFYAAITLEGKLGSAYEPIIFAALNSAKVMLAIGTKPEYFNAVWVKNEWSRFLKIVKNDRSKLLIPCYRDMDAYELPEEFAHLQAQDMSKIGFITDVVRGIKKVIKKEEAKSQPTPSADPVSNYNQIIAPLLRRVDIFLKDGAWGDADRYCERILDIDPENAEAYFYKLMAEYNIRNREDLGKCRANFSSNRNYEKVMLFGSNAIKRELSGYFDQVCEAMYLEAIRDMEIAKKWENRAVYNDAYQLFTRLANYKDSEMLAKRCKGFINADGIYEKAVRLYNIKEYTTSAKLFGMISWWRNAPAYLEKLRSKKRLKRILSAVGCSLIALLVIGGTVLVPAIMLIAVALG